MAGPLDDLLARLERELAGHPRRARALAEAGDHLRETAEALRAGGLDDEAAEREAVRRFGDVAEVAARLRSVSGSSKLLRVGLALAAAPCAAGFAVALFAGRSTTAVSLTLDVGALLACAAALAVALGVRIAGPVLVVGGAVLLAEAAITGSRSLIGPEPQSAFALWTLLLVAVGAGLWFLRPAE